MSDVPVQAADDERQPEATAALPGRSQQRRRRSRRGRRDGEDSYTAGDEAAAVVDNDHGEEGQPGKPEAREAVAADTSESAFSVNDALNRLHGYVEEARRRHSPELAGALADYVDRAERVAKGRLSAAYARPPDGLTPGLVARTLTSGRWLGWVESIRNLLIFLPVLFTWLEIASAAHAYGQLPPAPPADQPGAPSQADPFISLWQDGFGGEGGPFTLTLTETALAVGGLLALLVVTTVALNLLRGRETSRRARIEVAFASAMARSSVAPDDPRAETPQEQIEEFQRVGRELSDNLASLASDLRSQAAPLKDSVTTANVVMQQLSEIAGRQSEELSRITASLQEVAEVGGRLAGVQVALERAAASLDKIETAFGPTAQRLGTDVESVTEVARQVERAAVNLAATLSQMGRGIDAIERAGGQFNAIADRILHDPRLN